MVSVLCPWAFQLPGRAQSWVGRGCLGFWRPKVTSYDVLLQLLCLWEGVKGFGPFSKGDPLGFGSFPKGFFLALR